MIRIVSSNINTGKSSWMRQDFGNKINADGFVCIKTFQNDVHTGYNLLHLPSEKECCFIRKLDYIESGWHEAWQIGENYSFNLAGFIFANKIVEDAIKKRVSHFYLDEIGPLELQNKGFANLFWQLLEAKLSLTVAVRRPLLDKVIEKFSLKNYEIIEPWKTGA